jgi:hypothetical protein
MATVETISTHLPASTPVTQWLDQLFEDSNTRNNVNETCVKSNKPEQEEIYYTWPEILQIAQNKNGRIKVDGKWVDVTFKVIGDQLHVQYPLLS